MSKIAKIAGFAAEVAVQRLAVSIGCQPITFNTSQLLAILQSQQIGRHRLKQAMPYLLSEYGRLCGGDYKVCWSSIPAEIFLDYVFGLDVVFTWRGWRIGLDVTTKEATAQQKLALLRKGMLMPLWQELNLDVVAIAYVKGTTNAEQFKQGLKHLIRGEKLLQL